MGKSLLMLDDIGAPVSFISKVLNRRIQWVETITESANALTANDGEYAAFLVEPFRHRSEATQLQALMASARTRLKLPVVVYSTQPEETIFEEFQLRQGTHYDAYVSKSPGSPERMIATLGRLCPQ